MLLFNVYALKVREQTHLAVNEEAVMELVKSMLPKLVDNAPAIVVLLIILVHQQQQINMLLERCLAVAVCAH